MATYTLAAVLRCSVCLSLVFGSSAGFAEQASDTDIRLASCRKQIDETDQQIVALLNQRARIVAEVGKIKHEAHLPVLAPAREQQVLEHVVQMGSAGPLPSDRLRNIYQIIIREMRIWEAGLSEDNTDKPAENSSNSQR